MNVDNYVCSIISAEVLSILVCLVLLYANLFKQHEKTPRNRLFSWSVVCCMFGLIADATSWILDGNEKMLPLLYVSTVISLIMVFVINGVFISYITAYVRENYPVSSTLSRIYMLFSVIVIIAAIAYSGSGAIFYFENGCYNDGPYYIVYLVACLVCSIFCLITSLTNMRYMSSHERIAIMSYIIVPWIAGFLNLFFEHFSYAYPAIMLSMIIMYVMIQSERQNKMEMERRAIYYHSRHDVLTDLLNRMAYEERMEAMSHLDGTAAAIFTDVNGLKYTNDNFGHEAGDNLLTDYAKLLCRFFRKEDIYRISGDEFTVLLENANEEVLQTRLKLFSSALSENGIPVACVGSAYGNSADIRTLIKMAESEMYIAKDDFHSKHPEM